MMQVVFTPWTDEIKKINSSLGLKFVFNAFFYSEISLASLFMIKSLKTISAKIVILLKIGKS
jgi:hypothetical protein